MQLTLGQAAKQVGVSKPTLSKAISTGKLSATRREDGWWAIDPAELYRYVEANGHRFHPATGNGSRLETPDGNTAAVAEAQLRNAGMAVEIGMLREQLAEARCERDRWCAEASAWCDQAQAVTRQLTDQRERHTTTWWRWLRTTGALEGEENEPAYPDHSPHRRPVHH